MRSYTADSTHYKAGVACADCHMPYTRDGAAKFSTHDVHSPLLNAEAACGHATPMWTYVAERVEIIQDAGARHDGRHRRCPGRSHRGHQSRRRDPRRGPSRC